MYVAIDFGISNTDIAVSDKNQTSFYTLSSKSYSISLNDIKKILKKINVERSSIKVIGVTGGKSSDLEESLDGTKIKKINEIEAIGLGAKKLYGIKDEPTLIVSAGTGTACVQVQGDDFNHLGGIAVGGGMLEGLGSLLLKNSKGFEINELGVNGSRNELDLLLSLIHI